MAVVLKVKPKQPKVTPAEDVFVEDETGTSTEIAKLIEVIGEHQAQFAAAKALVDKKTKEILKPQTDRIKALCALLSAMDRPPEEEYLQRSEHWEIAVTKANKERSVRADKKKDLIAKLNKIKPGLGFQLVSIPLGEIDKYIAQIEQPEFIETKQVARYLKDIRPVRKSSDG